MNNSNHYRESDDLAAYTPPAARADEGVTCVTCNALSPSPRTGEGGIGLANLRRRLELLYGTAATLTTTASSGIFTATLTFPPLKVR